MDLKISAAMQAARIAVTAARTARDEARENERRTVARYTAGHTAIADVHAAEAEVATAEARLDDARRRYAEAREKSEPRFLDSLAPVARTLQDDLAAIAERLDTAIEPARQADAFATAHTLPTPRIVAQAKRVAVLAAELRSLANGQ
ncbi:hypothetical protein [Ancylobacter vacuolatus]|uniref:Sirohydrochlorin ferrochelatase n=1 Tax=Ancylobacter vacuolatus TaxID=223389 RepID=A0ABU0DLT8_9HYPH|nr:hypothetical protein [Ancylobacter vacuolatus]MDQ0349402.1 sirohydrochlorin ferrochelatase [Ancylobacter vacuolatus]